MRRTTAIAALAAIALAAAGCSSSGSSSGSSGSSSSAAAGGNTVDIYSSLPLQGASSAQTGPLVNGMKLALSQAGGKAGQFTVNYQSLDDSTAAAGKWDPGQTAANARKVASDPKAVFYIGEFNSGASEVSIPILNTAGHTAGEPGQHLRRPDHEPAGQRSRRAAEVLPDREADLPADRADRLDPGRRGPDRDEERGLHQGGRGQRQGGLRAGLATLLGLEKSFYGITIVSNTGIDPTAPNFRSYASTVQGQGANCFFFAGIVSNGAVQITKDVHSALPTAKIFGGDGVCTSSYTGASAGGVPAAIDPLIECTVATQDLAAYPGGKDFLAAYQAKYNVSSPDPYAIYGYAVMQLALNTIKNLGAQGNSKSAILSALFADKSVQSVLGTYGFDANGDTTLKSYGVYKVGSNGDPVFFQTVTPTKTVS